MVMSVYLEFLMDLWRRDIDEFLKRALNLLDQLLPEERDRVLDLYIRSLPEEVLAKVLAKAQRVA